MSTTETTIQKPVIRFSKPWNNKVGCDYFTTIRPHDAARYHLGRRFNLEVEMPSGNIIQMPVRIIRVYTQKLAEIHEAIYITDMGMDKPNAVKEIKRIYNQINGDTALFDLIVLEYDFEK